MTHPFRASLTAAIATFVAVTIQAQQSGTSRQPDAGGGFRFRSGVDLVNVTATVTDSSGRFVPGLRQDDFRVYEDDQLQTISHFSAERVPVSLGICLDTSGSMAGDKMRAAQAAFDRFLYDLLDPDDEVFLYRFSNDPVLVQGWTTDRQLVTRAIARITPNGGTAMYDTVAEAVPMAQQGRNAKKAVVVISDGNDTASRVGLREVKALVRQSEVLVYAVGIDGDDNVSGYRQPPPRAPIPFPFPPRGRGGWPPRMPPPTGGGGGTWSRGRSDERVNEAALRDMTDDSGGRTEIIRDPRDLNPATAGIADELSKQYYIGYQSTLKRDGRWHSIRVEVGNRSYRVRARRGYTAS